jgi:hypothetical protein
MVNKKWFARLGHARMTQEDTKSKRRKQTLPCADESAAMVLPE